MLVYYDRDLERPDGRTHPWTHSSSDASHRYYDFVERPELIRTSLEDVLPFGGRPCADAFYELLEWINGPASLFETNDSGMRPVGPSDEHQFPHSMKMTARIHLFLRDHSENTSRTGVVWLLGALQHCIEREDDGWKRGCIGLALQPTKFETLPAACEQIGWLHEVHFWAFGDTEAETEDAFARCVRNVLAVLKEINREMIDTAARLAR